MYKHFKFLILTFAICILHFAFSVEAAFQDVGEGARPVGMGKAYVGIADDVNSLYYNIAGIARMTSITLSATYSKLYTGVPGLNGGFVGYIQPLGESNEYGCVGINWTHLNVSESAASATYFENTIGFSYAYVLDEIMTKMGFPESHELSAGFKIKALNQQYGKNLWTDINPVFSKLAIWGFSVDTGLLYSPFPGTLSIGVSAENINQPNMKLESDEKVPLLLRTGIGLRLLDDLLTSYEADYRNKEWKAHVGAEYSLVKNTVELRSGFGIGMNKYMNANIGAGYNFSLDVIEGQLDYAYTYPFNFADGSFGTHRISFAIMEPVRPFVRVIKTKEQEREEKEKLEDEESQEKMEEKEKMEQKKKEEAKLKEEKAAQEEKEKLEKETEEEMKKIEQKEEIKTETNKETEMSEEEYKLKEQEKAKLKEKQRFEEWQKEEEELKLKEKAEKERLERRKKEEEAEEEFLNKQKNKK